MVTIPTKRTLVAVTREMIDLGVVIKSEVIVELADEVIDRAAKKSS